MTEADWVKIRNEYVNGSIGYRALAEKYKVSFSTLSKRSKQEQWFLQRKKQREKIATAVIRKTSSMIVEKEVDRVSRLLDLSDQLLSCLEGAIQELRKQTIKERTKIRELEYGDADKSGKLTREIINETEKVELVPGLIDRQGLKMLTAALKDIRDVQISPETNDDTLEKLDEVLGKIEGNI